MFIKREAAFQNNLNAQHEQSTHFQMHSKLAFQSLVINSKKINTEILKGCGKHIELLHEVKWMNNG